MGSIGTYIILFPNVESIVAYAFDGCVGWAAHDTVLSTACNSDYEILAALQTLETIVVRTQRHRIDAGKFRCSRLVEPGKGFVAIWIPAGLRSGLSR